MTTFRRLQQQSQRCIIRLAEFSGLNQDIIQNIVQYAKCLTKPDTQEIDENIFSAQMAIDFELTSSYMISLMFHSLMKGKKRSGITIEEYCKCICVFLTAKIDAKIDFVYSVYDVNVDGELSYIELYTLLKPCVLATDEEVDVEDAIKELIELVMAVTDTNEDRAISLEEFRELVKKNVLYLQLLGPCLPTDRLVQKFRAKFSGLSCYDIRKMFQNERGRLLKSLPPRSDQQPLYPVPLEIL